LTTLMPNNHRRRGALQAFTEELSEGHIVVAWELSRQVQPP
jgi:hypothetical protein